MRQSLMRTAIWAVALVCVALILGTGNIEAPPEPKVTEVTGTVDVGNFPDAVRFLGYTSQPILMPASTDVMALNRECPVEFPESRACRASEIYLMIPPPTLELAWVTVINADASSAGIFCLNTESQLGSCSAALLPVACCGF